MAFVQIWRASPKFRVGLVITLVSALILRKKPRAEVATVQR